MGWHKAAALERSMKDTVAPPATALTKQFIKYYHLRSIPGQIHLCGTSEKALGIALAINPCHSFWSSLNW